MKYLITYDLNKPLQDYSSLYEEIKNLGSWMHSMQNIWFISTNLTSNQISSKIVKVLDSNDKLFITEISNYAGWLEQEVWDWLNNH